MEGKITAKCCSRCDETKPINEFVPKKNFCKECKNLRIRELRFAKNWNKMKEVENEIGENNKLCGYCDKVFPKTYFKCRKCIDCKRECDRNSRKHNTDDCSIKREKYTDIVKRFIKSQRVRIYIALKQKQNKTIEYLGCNTEEFYNWMLYNFDDVLTLDNYGSFWHIDHVIPISHFNLENEHEQSIAFNWKNTMPLSAKENCTKNNRLVLSQIEQHLEKLISYHKEKNLEMPQEFIDLFAKHLAVRETP
jgi:hypothetical protein